MSAQKKKKITQLELRRLMNEQKKKLTGNAKKIESPLARYDKDGVLHCVICETTVRSENVWNVHLNSKNHKQNVIFKTREKETPPEEFKRPVSGTFKRPGPVPEAEAGPPKKLKGILKNPLTTKTNDSSTYTTGSKNIEIDSQECEFRQESNIDITKKNEESENKLLESVLPEGFFDDPKLDAKVRNIEYKDPIEEEWELFQKEIKEETNKAQQIIADDQEEATTERQIDEIDEQIRNWSRVLTLEKQKEKVNVNNVNPRSEAEQEHLSDDEDFEEFLDWRSKKSFENKMNKLLST